MSYDVKCGDLAETFLADTNYLQREDSALLVDKLAQHIQDAIEDFLNEAARGTD